MIANAGVVLSGILVMVLRDPPPDLVIGVFVPAIGARGGG